MWLLAYLVVFVVATAISAALVPACKRLARRWGLMARPHPDKARTEPTPLMGGAAIVASFLITIVGAYAVVMLARDGALASLVPEAVRQYAAGMARQGPRLAIILVGGVGITVLGLIDDKRGLGPLTKLIVEAAIAVALVLFGVRVSLFIP
ncbi:unnamed protein product, partial [marine sediment metagenome]